jgi:hypothetical protein
MSSTYSEEDIRRAAELREWLIKQISDRQEEVERLRTTLSIVDNLLKQGSFKAAANLGFSATTAPAAAGATTAEATTAQVQQQQPSQVASPPQQQPTSRQQQAGAPTLKATSDDDNSRRDNIRPLKRARDDFLLANAEVSPGAVVIVPSPGVNVNANTPPFRSFFLNRILEGMKNKDVERVNQGALRESDALNYKVEEEDNGSGIIKRIVINNYRDKDRLQEIFNTSAWVFTRMLEKSSGGSGGG